MAALFLMSTSVNVCLMIQMTLGPGPNLASGWRLVSGFLGYRGFLSDRAQYSSYYLSPKLCQTP